VSLRAELHALGADVVPAFEELHVPAVLLGADGRIRWLNRAARDLVGDLRGRHYNEVIAPYDIRKAQEVWARKALGAPATDLAFDAITPDGRTIPLEISSVAVRTGDRMVGVFGLLRHEGEIRPKVPTPPRLTPRQHEVLVHLGEGCATNEIAERLGISVETVRNHIRGIFRALGVRTRLQAVAAAREQGLI
jgi:PAS domain S-box-containing protein